MKELIKQLCEDFNLEYKDLLEFLLSHTTSKYYLLYDLYFEQYEITSTINNIVYKFQYSITKDNGDITYKLLNNTLKIV